MKSVNCEAQSSGRGLSVWTLKSPRVTTGLVLERAAGSQSLAIQEIRGVTTVIRYLQ